MTNYRYGGLLGILNFVADEMAATGCTHQEAEQRWHGYCEEQAFAAATGCTPEEAKTHRQIMMNPDCIKPPEINTRH